MKSKKKRSWKIRKQEGGKSVFNKKKEKKTRKILKVIKNCISFQIDVHCYFLIRNNKKCNKII